MPDAQNFSLPSEDRNFHLKNAEESYPIVKQTREKKADELLNLGLFGLNRAGRTRSATLESNVFVMANANYQQATVCFRYEAFEAAMVMARATIDAALYASKYTVIDEIRGFEIGMGGSTTSHSVAKGTRAEGAWESLREEAKVLGVKERRLKQIERIRDRYCNFSAHNASKQMQELQEYAKLNEAQRARARKPKWYISQRIAELILKETAKFLIDIRKGYVKKIEAGLNLKPEAL